jgi:hypothetical protein
MSNEFDWRHYIGHFLVAFVIACYGGIFFYIYLDGQYERDMQERGRKEAAASAQTDPIKENNGTNKAQKQNKEGRPVKKDTKKSQ